MPEQSFDTKGFLFGFIFLLLCCATGVGLRTGFLYFIHNTKETQSVFSVGTAPLAYAASAQSLSTSTSQRVINSLTIQDVIPQTGKFIAADLEHMKLYLYRDGAVVEEYPIQTKGRPGTPWETPNGLYAIQTKEENHFSSIGKVYMPFSMQFYGNYFIHGWTYYPDGTPTAATFSGGCIKLDTEDAEKVFEFADVGTKLFVYDKNVRNDSLSPLALGSTPPPPIGAHAYLVADVDTGDVYAERNSKEQVPIASVTKIMTALVANEIISLDRTVSVQKGSLAVPPAADDTTRQTFLVDDLFYPLLMQSSNGVADSLAAYYGKDGFVRWMNTTAVALDMASTTFADASGASADNRSTPEDLYRLAVYVANKKSFIWKITRTADKTITTVDGSKFAIRNFNEFTNLDSFIGGKVGHTTAAKDTMVSLFSTIIGGQERRVAVIVLGSDDYTSDTRSLAEWFTRLAGGTNTACAACAVPRERMRIEL